MTEQEQQAIRNALHEIYNNRMLCGHASLADQQVAGALKIIQRHLAEVSAVGNPSNRPRSTKPDAGEEAWEGD